MANLKDLVADIRRAIQRDPALSEEQVRRLAEAGVDLVPDREMPVNPELLRDVLERCCLRREGCDECDLTPSRPQDDGSDPGVPF